MKKLPKALYVTTKDDGDGFYFLASSRMDELGVEVGDKLTIGLYKLEGTYDAEGVVTTGHIKRVTTGHIKRVEKL